MITCWGWTMRRAADAAHASGCPIAGTHQRRQSQVSIRVLLSDDEALARERLRSLLEEESDLEIVAECGDGKSAISTIKREKPDLVFLDIQMPEIDGFGVVSALRAEQMPLTIFITAYD